MRHRTKLLAGSAVAVALLAGALFGGVLAESPSAGSTAADARWGDRGERALRHPRGRRAGRDREARDGARVVSQATSMRSHRSVSPIRCDGARRATPSSSRVRGWLCRRRSPPAHTIRPRRSVSGIWRSSVTSSATHSSSGVERTSSRHTPRGPTASSGTREIELGRYRRRVRDVRADGFPQAQPRLVRPHRLRPRADRRPSRRDLRDAARAGRCRRAAGADGLDTGRARQAGVRPRAGRGRRAPVPRRARDRSWLRLRARADGAGGGSPGPARCGGRAMPAGRRTRFRCLSSSAFSGTCSSVKGTRRGQAPAGDRGRDRPAPRRRTASASTSSRPSTAPTTASGPRETVALARKARADRPSIYGDDALGWALARAGRCDEAVTWSQRSLRLGTRDALLWFHRGYAAGCAGDAAGMKAWYEKALALNPHFSVQFAPLAREAVS